MKKAILFLLFIFYTIFSVFATKEYDLQEIINSIKCVSSPKVKDNYIVFTADSKARYVGIVFDFEDFTKVHHFEKLVTYDTENEPISSVLFYILDVPRKLSSVSYKLIIDGLWTLDPNNTMTSFNPATNLRFSTVLIENMGEEKTELIGENKVRFVYHDKTGETVRLAGTFTNWDSFIYELTESSPGVYEIIIPLSKGVHYYNYYKGTQAFTDKKNPNKAYTPDGRKVSFITLK
ncbi:MAG: isoamylase [Treponema sp.]|nr:isoamylase [Treponema sp.]